MSPPDANAQLSTTKLRVRSHKSQDDLTRIHALWRLCFKGQIDANDPLDAACTHVTIEDHDSGELLCAYRMLPLVGREIAQSYSAQFYNLSALAQFNGKMVEIGRFCIHPDHIGNPDILRLSWGAMTRYVDANGIALLFGCTSFAGTNPAPYLDAFAWLKERHLAPVQWRPRSNAPYIYDYAADLSRKADSKPAMRAMPPLLRTYLLMGGWVSDHAVVDRDMDTLHVFTGVEISAIPETRKRLLRALAG